MPLASVPPACGAFRVHSGHAHVPFARPVVAAARVSLWITVPQLAPLRLPAPFLGLPGCPPPRALLPLAAAPPRCSGRTPRPAPASAGLAGGGVAAAAAAARAVGAEAPEQDGGASAVRPRSGRGRRPPAAGRPLQPPARAPVSSAPFSGSGRGGAARGRRRGGPRRGSPPQLGRAPPGGAAGRRGQRSWSAGLARPGPRRGRSALLAGRTQGHGRDGARRRGPVRPPRGPGLRDLDLSPPGAEAEGGPAGPGPLPAGRPEQAARPRKPRGLHL